MNTAEKKVIIAIPVREYGFRIEGKSLVVCFMEIDMDIMLRGVSMKSQNSGATFCNIYTGGGIALSNTVLGGLAEEDNLLDALEHAVYEEGYSYEQVVRDFNEGNKGVVPFSYNGIQETLSYAPIDGTDWLLTYLVRDSVISECIAPVSEGIIRRSVLQSILTAAVQGLMFSYIIAQTRKNARLLLAEDNMINREIAELILTQMGFSVETAENGKLALDMVASSEPGYYDAVLMDIQMPVMDGYSAARAIRALDDKALAEIPILAMTANAFQEDVKAAMDAGMQAHIAKPVDVDKLTEALRSVLQPQP